MTPNFTSQPNRFPYLCTYQYTKLVSWPINAKRFAMNKHTFWHHLAMVVYSEIINLVWLLVGGVLILAGLAIFKFAQGEFFRLAIGLPLILIGASLALFKLHEIILVLARLNRLKALCVFCQ